MSASRVQAVDVLRGLAVMVLIPDMSGGFSLYRVAERHPESTFWLALAGQFMHVPWEGAALWDFVMPIFVLSIGVSLTLWLDSRQSRGLAPWQVHCSVLLRVVALLVLGIQLEVQRQTWFTEALPFVLLAIGLPWARWLTKPGAPDPTFRSSVELVVPAVVVFAVAIWQLLHLPALGDYDFNHILSQLGLVSGLAYLLRGRQVSGALLGCAAVLVAWSGSGMLWAWSHDIAPGPAGLWGHAHTMAADFDLWLHGALPRAEPYAGAQRRFFTLEFIPLVANAMVGVAAGRILLATPDRRRASGQLFLLGVAALALGLLARTAGVPLVKALWTPSWALFSAGVCVISLAALITLCESAAISRWTLPVAILGSNAVFLYVASTVERWRFVIYSERLLGTPYESMSLGPLIESFVVLAGLWTVAYLMHRRRIRISL